MPTTTSRTTFRELQALAKPAFQAATRPAQLPASPAVSVKPKSFTDHMQEWLANQPVEPHISYLEIKTRGGRA